MEALKIEFQPNLKSKIIELLSTFSPEELKISPIKENTFFDPNFEANKKAVEKAYKKFKSGKSKTYTIDEVDDYLDKKFAEYDN